MAQNRGIYALLIGSGISSSAGIPTGWQITLDLIKRVSVLKGAEPGLDVEKWYRELTGKEPTYSALLDDLTSTAAERRAIIDSYIEVSEAEEDSGHRSPTNAHRAIAELVRSGFIRVIVTTNFDRLMENALRDVGIEPTVIASPDALNGAEPISHARCFILKLHGDYKDERILNTETELNEYPEKYGKLLERIFDEYGLIICGWSGVWDSALRSALLRAPNRRYPVFWTAREPLVGVAQDLASARGAKIIEIDGADAFFGNLQNNVKALESQSKLDPFSMDLLVRKCKKFLSKPEYKIQLTDLIAEQTEALFMITDKEDFKVKGKLDNAEFNSRALRYVSATEPVATICTALGKWGNGDDLAIVVEMIRGLCKVASKEGSGIVEFLDLRYFPAVLVTSAYSLGLTRAERWSELHSFLSSDAEMRPGTQARIVDRLFLTAWSVGHRWLNIEGYEKQNNALSNHLHDLLQVWSKSTIGPTSDFSEVYELSEIVGALCHFERNHIDDVRKNLASGHVEFVPVGRSCWRQTHERIFAMIENEPTKRDLLAAKFANGNPELFALFKDAYVFYVSKYRW